MAVSSGVPRAVMGKSLPLVAGALLAIAAGGLVRPDPVAGTEAPDRRLVLVSTDTTTASFGGASTDGAHVFFETSATMLPEDTDSAADVYRWSGGRYAKVSADGPNGWPADFLATTPDGRTAVYRSLDALVPEDPDANMDLYVWREADPGPAYVAAGPNEELLRGLSDDGTRLLFETVDRLAAADTDDAADLYLWEAGELELVSGDTPPGPAGAEPALFAAFSADGSTVVFRAAAPLVPGAPASGATYEWRDGVLRVRLADPEPGIHELSGDGRVLSFYTKLPLVPGDTNADDDLYIDDEGTFHLLTASTPDAQMQFLDMAASYGVWAVFATSESLAAEDDDAKVDVYGWNRDEGGPVLFTPGTAEDAWPVGGRVGDPIVVRTRESLVAADVDGDWDLYLVDPYQPSIELATSGTRVEDPQLVALSMQGERLVFGSTVDLVGDDPDYGRFDLYEYRAAAGTFTSLGGPSSTHAIAPGAVSTNGEVAWLTTSSRLVPEDTGPYADVYLSTADATPPETHVSQILPTTTASDEVSVTFFAIDAPARFECRLDAEPWVDCRSPWHRTGIAPDGEHTAYVRAIDGSGNVEDPPVQASWVVDRTAPTGMVSVNGGASTTGRHLVRVALPADDQFSGIGRVRLSSSPATHDLGCGPRCTVLTDAYEDHYPSSPPHEILFDLSRPDYGGTDADGPRAVYVQWQDTVGNWSSVAQDSITVDLSTPIPTSVEVVVTEEPLPAGGGSFVGAIVTAADGTPVGEGTVSFTSEGLFSSIWYPLGSGGTVHHMVDAWPAGGHVVTATFSGTGTLATSSGSAVQLVGTDTASPSVTAPVARLPVDRTGVGSAIPVRIAWTGRDPEPGFGIARYELSQSTDGGAWTPVSTTLTGTSAIRQLSAGHEYRFRVRAIDWAGNRSGWAAGAMFELVARSESSTSVRYGGTWRRATSASYRGGAVRYATASGATATFRFTGRQVAWMAVLGPTRGRARVYVDGRYLRTVNLHAASVVTRRLVFATGFSRSASHTLTIRVLGTTGHPRVDVDGFAVIR